MAKNKKPNYKVLYPGISDEVVLFLKKSDRKMEYQEYDLKRAFFVVDKKQEKVCFIPSREDSIERLTENHVQFEDMQEDVAEQAVNLIMLEKLREYIDLLSKKERELINVLFFEGKSERKWSEITGIPQKTINNRKKAVLAKLKKLLENK